MSTQAPSHQNWTSDFLDPMRQIGDPLADEAVGQLFDTGNVKAVNALMKTLVENDQPPSDALPPVIREYLAASEGLPAWADPVKIKAGEDFSGALDPKLSLTCSATLCPSVMQRAKGCRFWLSPAACTPIPRAELSKRLR